MNNKKILFITQAALIAAIYVVVTYFVSALNLASGVIQVRISEALTVLPYFTPAAVPGLFLGCLINNIITGCVLPDIIFGSLATLAGAMVSYTLRKHKFLVTIPPVVANMLVVPFVLRYAYGFIFEFHGIDFSIPFYMATVGVGELISCCILGSLLIKVLSPYRHIIFSDFEEKNTDTKLDEFQKINIKNSISK